MGALTTLQLDNETSPKESRKSGKTTSVGDAANQERTLATVLMTRLYDADLQDKFNRLMLMGQNDQVLSTYPLNRKVTSIGRSRRNHIRIKDPLVSIKHLTVTVSDNACVVNDLDSSNGSFINGERLVGGRVLRDGEEIMLGKTALRFAVRQPDRPVGKDEKQIAAGSSAKKRGLAIIIAAMFFIMLSAAFIYLVPGIVPQRLSGGTPELEEQAAKPSGQPAVESETTLKPSSAQKNGTAVAVATAPAVGTVHIQRALEAYADGHLASAEKALTLISTTAQGRPQSIEARRIQSKIDTVRQMHARAREAQNRKAFSKALEYWDQLLIVDMQLVGDRPSYFAALAEQTVQTLSYEHALAAYRSKKHQKARQLCHVILQINPQNSDALALLAKIDPKA